VRTDVLLVRLMLELLALLLSTSTSVFKSTERLEAKNLVMPIENLILYDQRGFLKGPVSVPDRRFFCGRYQARFRCHR
jgi:hypothetical protein